MIVTRTPLRISFAGGGTDIPAFYEHSYGAVLSTPIDKYVYVTIKRHGALFNEGYRLNYSETEHVDRLDDMKNDIARECLRFLQVEPPIYISTVADLPAFSGLGSSSSFAVGLLNALHAFRGERASAGQLAEEAAQVEIGILNRPVGKQDHYAAAYGGLNVFRFMPDNTVTVEPQHLSDSTIDVLFRHLLMFWTGIVRDSSAVLVEQQRNIDSKMSDLEVIRGHALQLKVLFANGFDAAEFGHLLDDTWQMKRQLATTITSDRIDGWYDKAMHAGALGGKLCGAGGGGFLLFVAPPERHDAVRRELLELSAVQVSYEARGSHVLFAE